MVAILPRTVIKNTASMIKEVIPAKIWDPIDTKQSKKESISFNHIILADLNTWITWEYDRIIKLIQPEFIEILNTWTKIKHLNKLSSFHFHITFSCEEVLHYSQGQIKEARRCPNIISWTQSMKTTKFDKNHVPRHEVINTLSGVMKAGRQQSWEVELRSSLDILLQ